MKRVILLLTIISHFSFGQNNSPQYKSADKKTTQYTGVVPKAPVWSATDTTSGKSPVFKIETPRIKYKNAIVSTDTAKYKYLQAMSGDSTAWVLYKNFGGGGTSTIDTLKVGRIEQGRGTAPIFMYFNGVAWVQNDTSYIPRSGANNITGNLKSSQSSFKTGLATNNNFITFLNEVNTEIKSGSSTSDTRISAYSTSNGFADISVYNPSGGLYDRRFLVSGTGNNTPDQSFRIQNGLLYYFGDYTAQMTNDRTVPDIGKVAQMVHDTAVAHGSGGSGITSVYSANSDILVDSSITGKRKLTINKTLTSGYINIGDAKNTAFPRAISGDATVSNTGVLTITPTTGTVNFVKSNSPTFTGTPILSTPSATNLTITGMTGNGNIALPAQSVAPTAYAFGSNGTKIYSDTIGRVSYTRRNGNSVLNNNQDDFSPIIGEIINDKFDRATIGYTTTGSNVSASIVGGKMRISNTTGNTNATDYISINKLTWLPQFTFTAPLTAITNGNGIALGYFGSYECKFDMNEAGNRGTLTINSLVGSTPTQVATSATNALTYTNGEAMYFTLIVEGWKLIAKVGIVGSADRFVQVTYNGSLAVGAVPVPRPKQLLIYSFGGVQDISQILLTSNVKKYPALAVVGNSNMVGSASASNYPEIASSLITNNIPNGGVVYAASGANMQDFLTQIPELATYIKPQYVSIHLGTNDAGQAVTSATYLATLDSVIKKLIINNITPIVNTIIPTQTAGTNTLIVQYNTGISARSGRIIVVDQYNSPLQSGGLMPAAYTTDGIHLNTDGQQIFATTFLNSTSYLFGTNKSFFFGRNYASTSNEALEPSFQIKNTSPTQGNGSTILNRALFRLSSGNDATRFSIVANYNTGIYGTAVSAGTSTNSDLIFTSNATERLRLFASGSIMIGGTSATTDPSSLFYIAKTYSSSASPLLEPNIVISNLDPTIGNGTTAFNRAFLRLNAGNGTVQSIIGAYNNSAGVGGQGLLINTVTAHPIIFATSGTEYARLSPTGNFGIGTNNPQSVLHVSSANVPIMERVLSATNFAVNTVFVKATSTGDMTDGFGPSFAFQARDNAGVDNFLGSITTIRAGADNTSNMQLFTVNAGVGVECIRLTNLGRVGVGVTAPTAKLDVLSTTEQQRWLYDASNRLGLTVGSTGIATFDATGTATGIAFADAVTLSDVNLLLGTTTGTKIGTATSQKLAFYNSTPIIQPVNTVAINDVLVNLGLRASGGSSNFTTDIKLNNVGTGLFIKEGTNATMGTATLTAGTVTVSTTKVTANSRIYLTVNGGTLTNVGAVYISARSAGTSFAISSMNILDASDVAWVIVEPN